MVRVHCIGEILQSKNFVNQSKMSMNRSDLIVVHIYTSV